MSMRHAVLLLFCLCTIGNATAQQVTSSSVRRLVEVPSDQGLLVVAPQPDSPLVFEDAKLLIEVNSTGLWIQGFNLRNRGTKQIRAYTVAAAGTSEWSWEAPDPGRYIKPGETAPPFTESKEEIVTLTDELRQKFRLVGEMKGIVCLAVVSVEYEDGTRYRSKIYKNLKEYFDRVYSTDP